MGEEGNHKSDHEQTSMLGAAMLVELMHIDPSAIPADQIPAVIAALAGLEIALAARLMNSPRALAPYPPTEVEDRMLTVKECAERLRKSPKWLYRRVKTLPFARKLDHRSWLFSQKDLEKWLARKRT